MALSYMNVCNVWWVYYKVSFYRNKDAGTLVCFLLSQVHNVAFAFELMQDGGLQKPKARPEGARIILNANIISYYINYSKRQ